LFTSAAWQTRSLELFTEIARGLRDAHGQGVAHLDVTPRNILLKDDSEVKLIDWGLARRIDQDQDRSGRESTRRAGSPDYMAPEQVSEEERTPQQIRPGFPADVYALGGIGCLLLTGQPPRTSAAADREAAVRQMRDQALSPRHHDALYQRLNACGAPLFWVSLLKRCLSQNPGDRYADAVEVVRAIDTYRADQDRRERDAEKRAVRSRWVAIAAVLLGLTVFAVTGGLVASLSLWRRAEAGEAQALANVRNEEAARKEAQENFAMIRDVLNENINFTYLSFLLQARNGSSVRTDLLLKAEVCYASLLRKRDQDPELRRLYAYTLRTLGQITLDKGDPTEALALLDKSARLFEPLPPDGMRDPAWLAEAVVSYLYLGVAHERSGNRESASRALETSFRLWRALSDEQPSGSDGYDAFYTGGQLTQYLLRFGHSEEDILGRFEKCRRRPVASGNAPACDLIRDLLLPMAHWQSKQELTVRRAESLAASREVASILDRFYQHLPSDRKSRLSVNRCSILIGMFLRKGAALDESFRLLDQANRDLQKLCLEEPTGHYYFRELSRSWFEIGKIYWEKNETGDTLTAYRRALEAQQQALALAPSVRTYRDDLGTYHVRLGRKYCELGRPNEAEACFQERQSLWPGDIGKHEEAIQEVRKMGEGSRGREEETIPEGAAGTAALP
jgi:tetratricopeptide (TPR) repeat protein